MVAGVDEGIVWRLWERRHGVAGALCRLTGVRVATAGARRSHRTVVALVRAGAVGRNIMSGARPETHQTPAVGNMQARQQHRT